MNESQEKAVEKARKKYNVTDVVDLPGGRVQLEVTDGPTPFLFISETGVVEDEDGYVVNAYE